MGNRKKNKQQDLVKIVGEETGQDIMDNSDFPTLWFPQYGWCWELNSPHGFRYKMGSYTPKNREEYEALRKFSSNCKE